MTGCQSTRTGGSAVYPSVEDVTQRQRELLALARHRGRSARLRALRRAARRADRAAERLARARDETRQLRSELDVMS
jgi:hypothetical protein